MELPGKYISILEFFLDKRDITKGGVKGFDIPFNFTFKELEDAKGITSDELSEMLMILRTEQVMSEYGKEPVVGNVIIQENIVTIENCTTDKIKKCIEKINRKMGPDLLKVDLRERHVSYLNHEYQFSKTNRWRAFLCIYNERYYPVCYEKIFLRLYNKKTKTKNRTYNGKENRKEVQNTILGILRDMRKPRFPALIENVPDVGYKLKSVFY